MELIILNIKSFICHFNGALSIKNHVLSGEINEVYDSIQRLEYDHPIVDKQNLHSDVKNIGNDVKKAKVEYILHHGEIHKGK